jgi:hypothetical protein
VANVCGIIIRLILVVWVGARSYTSLQHLLIQAEDAPVEATAEAEEVLPQVVDPVQEQLAKQRRQLAGAEIALLDELRRLHGVQAGQDQARKELTAVSTRRQTLAGERAALERKTTGEKQAAQAAAVSLDEARQRCQRLKEQIQSLENIAPARQTLRYRTPVSRPLDAEELMFECIRGRVTFIDAAALLEEVKRTLHEKSEALRTTWEVQDLAGPVGPFQLRYKVERQRSGLEAGLESIRPESHGSFSYGVSAWFVEPITEVRGETLAAALKPGSEFRQIADGLDPKYAAVTFWVYPDSFPLYRKLRDYLYQRDLVVAGRPLPEGTPIGSTRHGTASRGQ